MVLLHNDAMLRCTDSLNFLPEPTDHGSERWTFESDASRSDASGGTSFSFAPVALRAGRLFPLLPEAISAAVFDLYEDGVWDLIASYDNGSHIAWHHLDETGNYMLQLVASDGTCAPAALLRSSTSVTRPFGQPSSDAAELAEDDEGGRGPHGAAQHVEKQYQQHQEDQEGLGEGHRNGTKLSRKDSTRPRSVGEFVGEIVGWLRKALSHDSSSLGGACAPHRVLMALQTGLNQPGVSFQFHTSVPTQWAAPLGEPSRQAFKWSGRKQAHAGVQLPQSAYSPLLPPYLIFGLGQESSPTPAMP